MLFYQRWSCGLGLDSLVEVFACSGEARQILVEDVLLGAHAVALHVLCPVQLAHVKVEHLAVEGRRASSGNKNSRLTSTLASSAVG